MIWNPSGIKNTAQCFQGLPPAQQCWSLATSLDTLNWSFLSPWDTLRLQQPGLFTLPELNSTEPKQLNLGCRMRSLQAIINEASTPCQPLTMGWSCRSCPCALGGQDPQGNRDQSLLTPLGTEVTVPEVVLADGTEQGTGSSPGMLAWACRAGTPPTTATAPGPSAAQIQNICQPGSAPLQQNRAAPWERRF